MNRRLNALSSRWSRPNCACNAGAAVAQRRALRELLVQAAEFLERRRRDGP
jgi:hypothetical protein